MSMRLYADRLGNALQGQGVEVERVRPPHVFPADLQKAWWLNKLDSYIGRFIRYPTMARQIARTSAADVFHIVDHGQAFLVASLDPRRTVVTCHDLMLLVAASGRLGHRPNRPVALRVFDQVSSFLHRAAAIVAVSNSTRADLIRYLDIEPARIEVVPHGLNQAFAPDPSARAAGRKRWGLEGKVILQIGGAFYKNVDGCLRVVASLRKQGIVSTLLRARRCLSGAEMRRAEKLGIGDCIRDLGPVADRDLSMLYNAADVLLFPSFYEGFGWPPLEAMACGIPVVCSRGGGLGEMSAPAALTCEPDDITRLTTHVAAVFTDESLARNLSARGRSHAEVFRWDVNAQRMVALYQRVRDAA